MPDSTKVTVGLSAKSIAAIETIKSITKEPNKANVIADALDIAKYILQQASEGNKIIISLPNGNRHELKLIEPLT